MNESEFLYWQSKLDKCTEQIERHTLFYRDGTPFPHPHGDDMISIFREREKKIKKIMEKELEIPK